MLSNSDSAYTSSGGLPLNSSNTNTNKTATTGTNTNNNSSYNLVGRTFSASVTSNISAIIPAPGHGGIGGGGGAPIVLMSERVTRIPTGALHALVPSQCVNKLIEFMHHRVLIDDSGIWYAEDQTQKELLEKHANTVKLEIQRAMTEHHDNRRNAQRQQQANKNSNLKNNHKNKKDDQNNNNSNNFNTTNDIGRSLLLSGSIPDNDIFNEFGDSSLPDSFLQSSTTLSGEGVVTTKDVSNNPKQQNNSTSINDDDYDAHESQPPQTRKEQQQRQTASNNLPSIDALATSSFVLPPDVNTLLVDSSGAELNIKEKQKPSSSNPDVKSTLSTTTNRATNNAALASSQHQQHHLLHDTTPSTSSNLADILGLNTNNNNNNKNAVTPSLIAQEYLRLASRNMVSDEEKQKMLERRIKTIPQGVLVVEIAGSDFQANEPFFVSDDPMFEDMTVSSKSMATTTISSSSSSSPTSQQQQQQQQHNKYQQQNHNQGRHANSNNNTNNKSKNKSNNRNQQQ